MKKLLSFIFILGVLYSCGDLLEIEPADNTTDANFPNSIDDLDQLVKGAITAYPGRAIVEASSVMSDDVRIAPTNTGQGAFFYNWGYTATTGNFEGIWDSFYVMNSRANFVIQNYTRLTPLPTEVDDYNQYVGEAFALRALAHFKLLQTFSAAYAPSNLGVPYVTSLAIENQPARNTAGDVVAAIKNDIATALTFLQTSFTDETRMNYNAVIALRAQVAFYEGDYGGAITDATNVLSNVSIATAGDFAGLWTDANDAGVIFEIGKDAANAGDNASGDLGGIYTRSSNADIFYNPSDELRALYDTGDIRPGAYFSGSGTTAEVEKYSASEGQPGLSDIYVFRAEELLLLRAEARVRNTSPNVTGALNDVNMLRMNRGAANATFSNTTDAINFILEERRRELAYEGYRYYDAKRTGTLFSREPADCVALPACTLTDVNRYTWPIPQDELFANGNMVQNPGY